MLKPEWINLLSLKALEGLPVSAASGCLVFYECNLQMSII